MNIYLFGVELAVLVLFCPAPDSYLYSDCSFCLYLLTIVGYYFLTVVVLWYCMDARPLATENIAHAT
ncbi:hypothetical protein B1F79_03110, partial [Coxiella-like endosymbiont of Rhipicephalus sanguineus]|nr:hypothetical protein [Coxiella-like endosymbiont of Rhipicephalus sanguineus]